jgi:hypothetical protein
MRDAVSEQGQGQHGADYGDHDVEDFQQFSLPVVASLLTG